MYNMIAIIICGLMAATISASALLNRDQDLLIRDTDLEQVFTSSNNHLNHTYRESWCFWQQNPFTQSWAVIFPNDGSPTKDGLDPKCKCGGLFEKKIRAKAFAISDWQCHYGPDSSACATFDSPDVVTTYSLYVNKVYKELYGVDLPCEEVNLPQKAVCPRGFGTGKNPGC